MKRKSQFSAPYLFPDNRQPEKLDRIDLGSSNSIYNETWLRNQLFAYPECLPIDEIDRSFSALVPICCELRTAAGRIDALYATPNGQLILLETKLWRNPEARRKVIGQILDYAKELKSWTYADLQREVSRATGEKGNSLYEIVAKSHPESILDEAGFVDEATRNLRNGRFLLLIAGDGIREEAHAIVNFLMSTGTMLFTLALVEVAIYQSSAGLIVQPRIIAKTEIIERIVLDREFNVDNGPGITKTSTTTQQQKVSDPLWNTFLKTLQLDDPEQTIPSSIRNNCVWFTFPWTSNIWLTAYVSKTDRELGLMLRMRREDGLGFFDYLQEDLEAINHELGLPVEWPEQSDGSSTTIIARKPISRNFPEEEQQQAIQYLQTGVNQFINCFRPRLTEFFKSEV
jgi:hypothetical protein